MSTITADELDRQFDIADWLHDLSDAEFTLSLYIDRPRRYRAQIAELQAEIATITDELSRRGVTLD